MWRWNTYGNLGYAAQSGRLQSKGTNQLISFSFFFLLPPEGLLTVPQPAVREVSLAVVSEGQLTRRTSRFVALNRVSTGLRPTQVTPCMNLQCLLGKLEEVQQRVQVWGQDGGQHNPQEVQPRSRPFEKVLSNKCWTNKPWLLSNKRTRGS